MTAALFDARQVRRAFSRSAAGYDAVAQLQRLAEARLIESLDYLDDPALQRAPPQRVLDLGSGSGILSITAVLLGAAHATGVDIDPKAEDIARENAAINQIFSDRFTAVTGDVIGDRAMMESLRGHYDVVLANIVADVIIPLSRVVPEFLQEDSVFICSGILNTRLAEVLAALEQNGLQIISTEQQEDWCRVTAALPEA